MPTPYKFAGPFAGKVALVTGGGSGIGAAAAQGLAADGAKVIIAGRRAEALGSIAATDPGAIRGAPCDVSDAGQVDALFADIAKDGASVDLLVNAAGVYTRSALAEFDMAEWQRMIAVNLVGVANAVHRALPEMLRRDFGRIVTLGSRSAHTPGAVTSAYSASKAGVEGLTRSVAHEILWQRRDRPDVQINVLYPGQTVTGLLGEEEAHPEKYQQPADVYPFIRDLFLRPRHAGMGQVIYRRKVVHRGDWKLRIKQLRANARSMLGVGLSKGATHDC